MHDFFKIFSQCLNLDLGRMSHGVHVTSLPLEKWRPSPLGSNKSFTARVRLLKTLASACQGDRE